MYMQTTITSFPLLRYIYHANQITILTIVIYRDERIRKLTANRASVPLVSLLFVSLSQLGL